MSKRNLRRYTRHLYRDRRRLAVATLMLVAMLGLGHNTLPDPIPYLPTELLATLPILAAIPLVTLFLPGYRHLIEVSLAGILIYMLLAMALPGSVFDYTGYHGFQPTGYLAFAAVLVVTRALLYGKWSDRLAARGTVTLSATMRSALDVKRVWYGLVPTPGQLDLNPDPEVVSIDYADPARRTIRLVTWMPPHELGETLLHVEEIQPLRYARFRMRVITGLRDSGIEGTTTIALRDCGDERVLTLSHEVQGLVPRRVLRGWLDDRFGRMMDVRLDALECNVGSGTRRTAKAPTPIGAQYTEAEFVHAGQADVDAGYAAAYGRRLSDRERTLIAGPSPDGQRSIRAA